MDKKRLLLLSILLTTLVCCSCGSTKVATQTIRDVQKDTLYQNSLQYDSIYIYKDRLIDRTKDTLYIHDKSVEYRYRLLRDTIRIVQIDSIPYVVTITKTKETIRPLSWYDHLTRACFWLLIGIALIKLGNNSLTKRNS